MKRLIENLKAFWSIIRRLSGDDAYERYLTHFTEHHHPGGLETSGLETENALTKEEFFRQWQDNKWKGVKRCC